MKKIIYKKNGLSKGQQIKLDINNLTLLKVVKLLAQSVTGFSLSIYKIYLFLKVTSALKNWPENIKIPLTIASIEKE